MNNSFFQSQDFKRTTGKLSDTGIKFFFKWFAIGVKTTANAIKMMFSSLLGK